MFLFEISQSLDCDRESLVAAAKITFRLKKSLALADVLLSLSLVGEEQNDRLNARRYRRSAHALLNKALPDLRLTRPRLEKSRLALLRGDLEQSRADAKAALKAFKKIWCTEGQEDTLHILDLVACEPGFDYASPFRIE